jgi:cytoskeletal protein CcmA (bactofilin family)
MGNEPATPQHDTFCAAEGLTDDSAVLQAPRPSAWPADTGLGVPPYRPVPSKEAPVMARTPFSAPSLGVPSTPAPPPANPAPSLVAPPRPIPVPDRMQEPLERRTLVVGRGISVQGTVADAERLVVEGTVEASMIHAAELSIAQGGVFKGEVEVEDAEIGGTIDGTLTVRGNLIVRATGKVLGTARCRRLQVEDGGQITGRIEMLTEGLAKVEVSRQVEAVG